MLPRVPGGTTRPLAVPGGAYEPIGVAGRAPNGIACAHVTHTFVYAVDTMGQCVCENGESDVCGSNMTIVSSVPVMHETRASVRIRFSRCRPGTIVAARMQEHIEEEKVVWGGHTYHAP